MVAYDAIARANELRPNTFSDDLKVMWLAALDAEIRELVGENENRYHFADGINHHIPFIEEEEEFTRNTELAMPDPRAMFYVTYLCARIDEANEDSDLFMNDMTLYNSERQDACAWWVRNHKPKRTKYVRGL